MIVAWHVNSLNGVPHCVLWYGTVPDEAASSSKYLIKQHTVLTAEQEAEVWAQPDGSRCNFCAKKYPYNDPNPVDTDAKTVILTEHMTEIVNVVETIEAS